MGNLRASGKISISGRATISAEQARTGRYIVANELHAQVQEWATLPNHENHELSLRFAHFLTAVPTLSKKIVCFRGRSIAATSTPSAKDMGPPPPQHSISQRYNRAGNPALYLCDDASAVPRELAATSNPIWIQRFVLPAGALAIADFRVGEVAELIDQTFWFAEHAGEFPPSLSFSQHVADLVVSRFDGMLVPGVRGDRAFRYSNVVVLKRVNQWNTWLDTAWVPRLAGAA